MKKTIGKYMVVGMVALTMTACNDSFLELSLIHISEPTRLID